MEIKCTVQELKELIESKKETSAAETTDVKIKLDGKEIISSLAKYQNFQKANHGKLAKH